MSSESLLVEVSTSYDEFAAGVTACLRTWSVLRTAMENGWNNNVNNNHGEDLRSMILSCMNGIDRIPKKPIASLYDLEDYISYYMEDIYCIILEDNSEQQLSQTIYTLYEQCCFYNNYILSRQLVSIDMNNTNKLSQLPILQESILQIDSDSDDDNMDDDDDNNTNNNNNLKTDNNDNMDMDMMDNTPEQQQQEQQQMEQQQIQQQQIQLQQQVQQLVQQQQLQRVQSQQQSQQGQSLIIPCINYSAKIYWNQPLFTNNIIKKKKTSSQRVRQLGEQEDGVVENINNKPIIDDDGFATIPIKSKKKAPK